jgi:VWFA-related protein
LTRIPLSLLIFIVATGVSSVAEDEIVFRSDVALVRVDAQVVDRQNRAITGLTAEDFVLLENGKPQPIKNFASENVPVDFLLLLDVSGSMQTHVERVATAAREALLVLGREDRVAIMVFDRATRLRMPFRKNQDEILRGLNDVLRQEDFNGGTDISRGLYEAISYISREGRREARRAIVILTDDQTERGSDENGITRALANANTVLSALLAPDALHSGRLGTGGGWPGGGGGWPGSGGPLGGIILGRRGPYGGRSPGPVITGARTHSAGTAEIARRSGGDSMRVDDAAALETTLARLRQRYTLHFNLPEGVKPGQERNIEVELSAQARKRYPDAEVRYRRVHFGEEGIGNDEPVVVSKTSRRLPEDSNTTAADSAKQSDPRLRRRPGASGGESRSTAGPLESTTSDGGWRRSSDPAPAPANSQTVEGSGTKPAASEPAKPGGWRRVKPGEEP